MREEPESHIEPRGIWKSDLLTKSHMQSYAINVVARVEPNRKILVGLHMLMYPPLWISLGRLGAKTVSFPGIIERTEAGSTGESLHLENEGQEDRCLVANLLLHMSSSVRDEYDGFVAFPKQVWAKVEVKNYRGVVTDQKLELYGDSHGCASVL